MRVLIVGIVFWAMTGAASGNSSVDSDESVIFFPTDAYLDGGQQHWILPVHGWIYELESDSVTRQKLLDVVAAKLGLGSESTANALFRERAAMFLVDNERGEDIVARADSVVGQLEPSRSNGHFYGTLALPKGADSLPTGQRWVEISAILDRKDSRQFVGYTQLLEANGVSVISDVDDTIKISNVLDKRALLENTFLKPFSSVPGMAEVYRGWAKAGAAFHYVSASPWQLYPSLEAFVDAGDFPRGSFSLRMFRLKDRSFLDFMKSSEEYKLDTIRAILNSFPERQFILVGDSGERDPEIYGTIFREFPDQVRHVYIRDICGVPNLESRLREAFRDVPRENWTLFQNAQSLHAQTF